MRPTRRSAPAGSSRQPRRDAAAVPHAPCRPPSGGDRRRGRARRGRAQSARPRLRRSRASRGRRRPRKPRALHAPGPRADPRHRRQRHLGHLRRRLPPAARHLRRRNVVAARPLHRRRARERLATLDTEGTVRWTLRDPASRSRAGRAAPQTPHRVPQRQPAPRRRGRRDGRLRGRRRAGGRNTACVALGLRVHPRLRHRGRARPRARHRKGRPALGRDATGSTAVARVVEQRPEPLVLSPGRVSILEGASGRLIGGGPAPDVAAVAFRPGTTDYAELHRSAAGAASRSAHGRCSASAASCAVSPGRRTGAGSSSARRRPTSGSSSAPREQDRGGVEHLGPVPLPDLPRGRRLGPGRREDRLMLVPGDRFPMRSSGRRRARIRSTSRPLYAGTASCSSASTSSTGRPAERTR